MKSVSRFGKAKKGFTVVELLVVIVIVAILATIITISYRGIYRSATEGALKTEIRSASQKLTIYSLENNNSYPADCTTAGVELGGKFNLACVSLSHAFCVSAGSDGLSYIATSTQQSPLVGFCDGIDGIAGEPTGVDGTLIQTITTATCPNHKTRAVDARDSRTYWVKKMADGKCWMLTNLAYAGGGQNTYGDVIPVGDGSAGTLNDGTSTALSSYTLAKFYVSPSANPSAEPTSPTTSANGGISAPQYGYHYNWCAAMGAQNGGAKPNTSACTNSSTPAPNTTVSVCPAGWRLPTGEPATGEFSLLNNAVNRGLTSTNVGLRALWLTQYAGYWGAGNTFSSGDTYSMHWSSTQITGIYTRNLVTSDIWVSPSTYTTYSTKPTGNSVRCVANS